MNSHNTLKPFAPARQELSAAQAVVLAAMQRPDRCIHLLRPGRLVRVNSHNTLKPFAPARQELSAAQAVVLAAMQRPDRCIHLLRPGAWSE